MFVLFFLFLSLPLFSLAPSSLFLSLRSFSSLTPKPLPAHIELKKPSYYQQKFLKRLRKTERYAKKKQYSGKIAFLDSTDIERGAFSIPHRVRLETQEICMLIEPESVSTFPQQILKSIVQFFRAESHLYCKSPQKKHEQIDLFYQTLFDEKFSSFPLDKELLDYLKPSSYHSLEGTLYSHFQFLVESFEKNPLLWNQLPPEQQAYLLFVFSRTLILSNEFLAAKHIAFTLCLLAEPFIQSNNHLITFIIQGNINALVKHSTDCSFPKGFVALCDSFKLRLMHSLKYKGIVPIRYTVGDQNLLHYFHELDLTVFSKKRPDLVHPFSKPILELLHLLSAQGIVQCDSKPDNYLVSFENNSLSLVVTDVSSLFTHVGFKETLFNYDLISILCLHSMIQFPNFSQTVKSLSMSQEKHHPIVEEVFSKLVSFSFVRQFLTNPRSTLPTFFSPHYKNIFFKLCSQMIAQDYTNKTTHFLSFLSIQKPYNFKSPKFMSCLLFLCLINRFQLSNASINLSHMRLFEQFLESMMLLPEIDFYGYFIKPHQMDWLFIYHPNKDQIISTQSLLVNIPRIFEESKLIVSSYFFNNRSVSKKEISHIIQESTKTMRFSTPFSFRQKTLEVQTLVRQKVQLQFQTTLFA